MLLEKALGKTFTHKKDSAEGIREREKYYQVLADFFKTLIPICDKKLRQVKKEKLYLQLAGNAFHEMPLSVM